MDQGAEKNKKESMPSRRYQYEDLICQCFDEIILTCLRLAIPPQFLVFFSTTKLGSPHPHPPEFTKSIVYVYSSISGTI